MVALTLTARRFVSSTTGTRGMPYVLFAYYYFSSNVILTSYSCTLLIEKVTVMFIYLKLIFLPFSEVGVYNLKCKLYVFIVCHINSVIMHVCYRRSKALQSLCFLLYIVMPSLKTFSYLILYYFRSWSSDHWSSSSISPT